MAKEEIQWLEEICEYYSFYIINNRVYLGLHVYEGIGMVFRPYRNVVMLEHFPLWVQKDDITEIACEYPIIVLPRRFDSIKEHILELENIYC